MNDLKLLWQLLIRYSPSEMINGEDFTYFPSILAGKRLKKRGLDLKIHMLGSDNENHPIQETVIYFQFPKYLMIFDHLRMLFFPTIKYGHYTSPFRELEKHKEIIKFNINNFNKNNWEWPEVLRILA